jgi:uncharacterized protein YlxW (UPF0749 family)
MTPPTSHRTPAPQTTLPGRRPDESMTLLTSMMERPLDPGYAAAAERRTAAGLPAATSTATPAVLVAVLVMGLVFAVGALSLGRRDTTASRARADLVSQIQGRRAAADQSARQVQALQAQIDRLQANALGGQGDLAGRLSDLALVTGSAAASGPGLTVTLDDARKQGGNSADGNPRTQAEADDGKVLSKDLQMVANGLWEAGAEAVAINGQRLTARSAIRFAGEAILVNYRPLTRPYVLTAIGSPDLEANFAESAGGSYVRALKDNYGVRVTMATSKRLTVPAATSLTTRYATVPGGATATEGSGGGTGTATTGPTGSGTSTDSSTTTDTPDSTEPAQ